MYISHVSLENIRGFSGQRRVDLALTRPHGAHAGWTVLAGPNGSGKTSLLRAIALTFGGPMIASTLVPDFRTWKTSGLPDGYTKLRLVSGPEDFQPKNGRRAKHLDLTMRWETDERREALRPGSQPRLSSSVSVDSAAPTPVSSALRGPWQDDPIGWFCAAYGPFRRLSGGSAIIQRFMETPGPVARLATLFYGDTSLAGGVVWLIDKHRRALEGNRSADELRGTALHILADGLLPDGYEVVDVNSDGLWTSGNGHRLPLWEMSDGHRSTVALVMDLIRQVHDCYGDLHFEMRGHTPVITAPGVVIIDEMETHLDAPGQRRISAWLKKHFPNMQFIVATHSAYVCQAADPGGLIHLPGPGKDEPPRVVDQDRYYRIVSGGDYAEVLAVTGGAL